MRGLVLIAVVAFSILLNAQDRDGGATALRSAVPRVVPKDVVISSIDERPEGVVVTGRAKTNEVVAEFMRAIAGTLVSTPRGMGRIVERKTERRTVRVELFDAMHDAVMDFTTSEVSGFEVELLRAEHKGSAPRAESVEFEIRVRPK